MPSPLRLGEQDYCATSGPIHHTRQKKVRVSANIQTDLESGKYNLLTFLIPTTSNNDPDPHNKLRVTKRKYRIDGYSSDYGTDLK